MDKSLTKRLIIGAITALVVVYVVYLFVSSNYKSTNIKTEIATYMSVTDSIDTTGTILRDEEYLTSDNGGVLVFDVENGDKVTANGVIAHVYDSEEQAVNTKKIEALDSKISELKTLNKVMSSTNIGLDNVNGQMKNGLVNFAYQLNSLDFSDINDAESSLLYTINERQIITGQVKNFNSKIEEYEAEKSQLESNASQSNSVIRTKDSGYFEANTDGYENSYDIKNIKDITLEDYNNLQPQTNPPSNSIGKMIKGVMWYVVCPVSSDEAITLSHMDDTVYLNMPMACSEQIPSKIVAINQKTVNNNAVVVFQCDYMSKSLAQARSETVQIGLGEYDGLRVSKKALHDGIIKTETTDKDGNTVTKEQKVQGVYTLYGNKLLFKQVVVLYSGNDYVVCDMSEDNEKLVNGETISLYDEIVVKGDDLYDGKVI